MTAAGRSRWRAVAGATLVALTAAGCGQAGDADPDPAPGAPAATTAPASAAPATQTAPQPPGSYRTAEDLCEAADLTALTEVFGAARDGHHQSRTSGPATAQACAIGLGDPIAGHAMVLVTVGPPGQAMFEGLRRVQQESGQVTPVPGVGTDAYAYVEAGTGWHVVAYDGTLHISVSASALGTDDEPGGPEMIDRLARVARGTMTALRR